MKEIITDNPFVWELSRWFFEMTNKVYKKRFDYIRDYFKDNPSVLDIGCGTGWCANMTKGRYLGIDVKPDFIEFAKRKKFKTEKEFRCADAETIAREEKKFDIVLIFDVIHHIDKEECEKLVKILPKINTRYLINSEPFDIEWSFFDRWVKKHESGKFYDTLVFFNDIIKTNYDVVSSETVKTRLMETRITIYKSKNAPTGMIEC